VIVVYDISNRESFEKVKDWISEVRDHALDDVPIALVGNKNDLDQRKKVSTCEAKKFSDESGLMFFETSAKNTSGINTVFGMLADTIFENMCDGANEIPCQVGSKFTMRSSVDLRKSFEKTRLSFDFKSKQTKKKQCCNS